MAVYCVSYNEQNKDNEPLIQAIQNYGLWWHQAQSTWFIETNQTTRQVLDNLRIFTRTDDKIIVVKVQKSWWASGYTKEEYEWMKNRNFL